MTWRKVVRLKVAADPWFVDYSPPGTFWRLGSEVVQVVRWRDREAVWVKRG